LLHPAGLCYCCRTHLLPLLLLNLLPCLLLLSLWTDRAPLQEQLPVPAQDIKACLLEVLHPLRHGLATCRVYV
jgi:hypothetical protein